LLTFVGVGFFFRKRAGDVVPLSLNFFLFTVRAGTLRVTRSPNTTLFDEGFFFFLSQMFSCEISVALSTAIGLSFFLDSGSSPDFGMPTRLDGASF